jgi:hypothetical protein
MIPELGDWKWYIEAVLRGRLPFPIPIYLKYLAYQAVVSFLSYLRLMGTPKWAG